MLIKQCDCYNKCDSEVFLLESIPEYGSLEILLSCMNEADFSIVYRTKIHTNILIVNQINLKNGLFDQLQIERKVCGNFRREYNIRKIDTPTHGLSVSRNIALRHAEGSICLLCDDDEILDDNYETTILNAYKKYKDADIICFRMSNQPSRLKQVPQRLNQWTVLRIASWQISFRRDSILRAGILFDELLGAGTGNGAGEEVKFLRDCVKSGLHLYYVPDNIGKVKQEKSTWFKGYDKDFFYKRGITNRYIFGPFVATLYAGYYSIVKWRLYKRNMTMWQAFYYTMQGIIANDIVKEKKNRSK